jgi:hypothetical protein
MMSEARARLLAELVWLFRYEAVEHFTSWFDGFWLHGACRDAFSVREGEALDVMLDVTSFYASPEHRDEYPGYTGEAEVYAVARLVFNVVLRGDVLVDERPARWGHF